MTAFLLRIRRLAGDPSLTRLTEGVAWSGLSVIAERAFTLIQAFYIARLLDVELFGKYGLLLTTIGLLSSVSGLQLGLTAAVFVSRYAESQPARTAAVIRLCEFAGMTLALLSVLLVVIAPTFVALQLLGSGAHADVVVVAAAICLLAVVGGIQEGILQGFEEYRTLSVVRIATALLAFGLVFLLGRSGDLASVFVAIGAGSLVRTIALVAAKEMIVRRMKLRTELRAVIAVRRIILEFSIPSVAISLLTGSTAWYGMLLLARNSGGFTELAYLTAGQQWRGLVLLVSSTIASVMIPTMSRLYGSGDAEAVRRVHRINVAANIAIAIAVVAIVSLTSNLILRAYGASFVEGRLVFVLTAAVSIPAVYITVLQNFFVTHDRMWDLFYQTVMQSLTLAIAYWYVVPYYGALGYAVATLVVGFLTAIMVHIWIVPHIKGSRQLRTEERR